LDEKTGDRLPYLDSIYLKKIVDEMVRWTALRSGDVDYINVPPRNIVVQEMKKPTPGIVTFVPHPVACDAIIFNTTKPPYDNKKVRQAFAYGIDKNEMIKAAYWGLADTLNNQPFSCQSWAYIAVQDREFNPGKAKQLLAEAGYADGFKTEIFTFSDVTRVEGSNAVVGQLKKIGIDATIKIIDRAPFWEQCRKGEFSIAFRGDSERLDPDDVYYPWFHSSEVGKNNWPRYTNKELDSLLERGRTLWKWEDRMPIYKKVVEKVREDLPLLYLAKPINPMAWRDYLKGHEGGASTWFGYSGGGMKYVWLDK
jgi:peptide/nickel transport system substrate-binding protein